MQNNFQDIINLFENHKTIINNAFKDIKIFISEGIAQKHTFTNVKGCNLLKTIQYKNLVDWDVRGDVDPLNEQNFMRYNGNCGLTFLLIKVVQMERKNNLKQLISVLRRCAFNEPSKVKIHYSDYQDHLYGNSFCEEKTKEKSYGRNFYKQDVPPKGHFRIRGKQIICLKPHEQKYLQQFFK